MRAMDTDTGLGDRRTLRVGDRMIELAGPRTTALLLCWLAAHRRIRSLTLGGKRLSVLVLWDPQGSAEAGYSDADVDAMERLTFGDQGGDDGE